MLALATAPQSTPHAIVRAKERYGIDLSMADLRQLERRCAKGEGYCGGNQDGTSYHSLVLFDRVLWCVYRETRIITIMPPTVGAAAGLEQDRQKFRRLHGFARRRR